MRPLSAFILLGWLATAQESALAMPFSVRRPMAAAPYENSTRHEISRGFDSSIHNLLGGQSHGGSGIRFGAGGSSSAISTPSKGQVTQDLKVASQPKKQSH